MTDPTEMRVNAQAGVLAVRDWGGAGPTLLLIHGVFGSAEYFDGIAGELANGARVIGYDLRGHGRSDSGDPTLDSHVADLFGIIEALDLDAVVAVGVSFGGYVALRAAAERPELFASVVNVEGPVGDRTDITGPEPIGSLIRQSMSAQPYPWEGTEAELDDKVSQAREEGNHGSRRQYEQIGPDRFRQRPSLDDAVSIVTTGYLPFASTYDRLDLPVLVLVGRQSSVINLTPEARQDAARSLTGRHDNVDLRFLDGGHDLVKERPEEILSLLRGWLGSLDHPG
jgi:pimeloyl-ACP methyl ester carboxylesterase